MRLNVYTHVQYVPFTIYTYCFIYTSNSSNIVLHNKLLKQKWRIKVKRKSFYHQTNAKERLSAINYEEIPHRVVSDNRYKLWQINIRDFDTLARAPRNQRSKLRNYFPREPNN